MQFDVIVWRKFYDEVQRLGKLLKDSRIDEFGSPPVHDLSDQEQKDLEAEIKFISARCNKYLDSTYMKPRPPLWNYDRTDERTWLSSPKFAYRNLIKIKGKPAKGGR